MGKEFYFETDDRLDRKKYAEFLKTLLEHCDEYRREDSEGAYVIAIDSPWGTGKTRFAKMLRNYLEGRVPTLVNGIVDQSVTPDPSEDRLFNVIYYNSWETDYWSDALEPLINSIFESQLLEVEGAEADNAKLKDAIVRILKGMGLALIKLALGDAASSVFQGAIDGLNDVPDDPLAALKSKASQYSEFKSALGSVIARTNKKLVIIVDELDRCRPTFSIETLEIVKHLFDVPGLMFIFALDLRQLSYSVETVYGQNMDAPGYLCRFFDYIGRIPAPNILEFIYERFSEFPYYRKNPDHYYKNNSEFIRRLAETFRFSLRDLNIILNTYKIMIDNFLYKYNDYIKHQVYIFLLALKYKDIDAYNRLFKITPDKPSQAIAISDKHLLNKYSDFELFIKALQNDVLLRNTSLELAISGARTQKRHYMITSVELSGYASVRNYAINFRNEQDGEEFYLSSSMKRDFSWGSILYLEDILKWDRIKDMSLPEYMYSQLEMFNFALPSEGSES